MAHVEPEALPNRQRVRPQAALATLENTQSKGAEVTDIGPRIAARSPRSTGWLLRGLDAQELVYLRHAALHPAHMMVIVGPIFVLIVGWGVLALVTSFLLTELALAVAVPRIRPFRRFVDQKLDVEEREDASKSRGLLLAKMTSEHRSELEGLESLADRIRARVLPRGARFEGSDCLGLASLLASFVSVAIAYRECKECLASVNRLALTDEIRALSAARLTSPPQARALTESRIRVAELRAARWDRSFEDLEAMGHQLAMIRELVHLMHEQCSAVSDSADITAELESAISAAREGEGAVRELGDLLVERRTVDPRLLEIGRSRWCPDGEDGE